MEGEDLLLGVFWRLLVSRYKTRYISRALTIWVLEENLSINTTRSDQGWIQSLDLVSSHDDLDITTVIETIQLVKKFQHGSLNFSLTT
jgi:hypothetical protein